jgi:hypothetical protein
MFGDNSKAAQEATMTLQSVAPAPGASQLSHVRDVSWGPAVLAELGEGGLRSVGLGLMVSFRKVDVGALRVAGDAAQSSFDKGAAFNLGIAAMVDPDVKVLGPGLTEGAPVPTGTAIRLDTKTRLGWAVVFSTRF